MLRIPDFQATFCPVTLAPISSGPAARDTLVRIHNISSTQITANVCVWNEHKELVFDFNIALTGSGVEVFSVASMLRGDPRALPCPHSPVPLLGPFSIVIFSRTLFLLSPSYSPNGEMHGDIINPIHGYITIEELHGNGSETSLRVDYFIGKPDSFVTNPDARMVELTHSEDVPIVYSRQSWRGLGVVLKESQMKVREAIRLIESDGWYYIASKGSHRQYKHPVKQGRVTIPGKLSDDLAPGTFNSILKQAGLKA